MKKLLLAFVVCLIALCPPLVSAHVPFALAKVDSVSAGAAAGGGTFSTGNANMTGANLLVAAVCSYAGATAPTLSDSSSNTWTALTEQTGVAVARMRMYYVASPTVTSSQSFTATGAGAFASIAVIGFSGAHTAPFINENGGGGNGTSGASTGSITPTEDNAVVVSGACIDAASISGVSGSSIAIDQNVAYSAGAHLSGAEAFVIQTTAGGVDAAWTWSGTRVYAMSIASFKSAAAAPASFIPAIINNPIRGGGGMVLGLPHETFGIRAPDAGGGRYRDNRGLRMDGFRSRAVDRPSRPLVSLGGGR